MRERDNGRAGGGRGGNNRFAYVYARARTHTHTHCNQAEGGGGGEAGNEGARILHALGSPQVPSARGWLHYHQLTPAA